MDKNKPIVIFTTFWEAVAIRENGCILTDEYIVTFNKSDCNILSVALAQPPKMKFPNLDFLNPSWGILKSYKENKDWDSYKKSYRAIMIKNKKEIADWVDSLDPEKVYLLCCWENTCKGANCHRKIVYDALICSSRTKEKVNCIYRHGDVSQTQKEKDISSFVSVKKNISEHVEDSKKNKIKEALSQHPMEYCLVIPDEIDKGIDEITPIDEYDIVILSISGLKVRIQIGGLCDSLFSSVSRFVSLGGDCVLFLNGNKIFAKFKPNSLIYTSHSSESSVTCDIELYDIDDKEASHYNDRRTGSIFYTI